MLVRMANREDPDQTASLEKQFDLGLNCLSRVFCQGTSVQNLRTLTVFICYHTSIAFTCMLISSLKST